MPGDIDDLLSGDDRLMDVAEVAAVFRVSPKTVRRWNKTGKLTAIRTQGGHRRFRESEVRDLLLGGSDGVGN